MHFRLIALVSLLAALLSGCVKPSAPIAPGVSVSLRYPVLLAGQHRLEVKDDEERLTTTSGATGLNFPELTLLDSEGALYTVRKVTEFDRKSAVLDLGTSHFRVFLDLKAGGTASLAGAKALVKEVALSSEDLQDGQAAAQAIDAAGSFPELIEVARKSWSWR